MDPNLSHFLDHLFDGQAEEHADTIRWVELMAETEALDWELLERYARSGCFHLIDRYLAEIQGHVMNRVDDEDSGDGAAEVDLSGRTPFDESFYIDGPAEEFSSKKGGLSYSHSFDSDWSSGWDMEIDLGGIDD